MTSKKSLIIGIAACLISLVGCTNQMQSAEKTPNQPIPVPCVGCDADAHGCRASAGYSWCAAENSCVQLWVLEKTKGIDLSGDNFQKYCNSNTKK